VSEFFGDVRTFSFCIVSWTDIHYISHLSHFLTIFGLNLSCFIFSSGWDVNIKTEAWRDKYKQMNMLTQSSSLLFADSSLLLHLRWRASLSFFISFSSDVNWSDHSV
jgi:hypothetical protein